MHPRLEPQGHAKFVIDIGIAVGQVRLVDRLNHQIRDVINGRVVVRASHRTRAQCRLYDLFQEEVGGDAHLGIRASNRTDNETFLLFGHAGLPRRRALHGAFDLSQVLRGSGRGSTSLRLGSILEPSHLLTALTHFTSVVITCPVVPGGNFFTSDFAQWCCAHFITSVSG